MTIPEATIWTGASGYHYTYFVHKLPFEIEPGRFGNYVYAKKVDETWVPLYIGQGDLSAQTDIRSHPQSPCLKLKDATHVHVRVNPYEAARQDEAADLLAANPQAYQPTGCNEKEPAL